MKFASLLFKPKWQDRDADVRLAAIAAREGGADLDAALPELTRSDPDPRVRTAALKRLGDYERWRERSTADADPALRRLARDTYLSLMCNGARRPPLPRLIAELETLSPAEIETVAAQSDNRDLRRAALGYVARAAWLAERAIADPDPALRQVALARIDDPNLLERIAERARRTDKNVSRAARDRLMALRLEARDAGAIGAHARTLCERVDALLRTPGDIAAARNAIEAEWCALGDAIPENLRARYRGAVALLERRLAQVPPPSPAHEPGAAPPPPDVVAEADAVAEPAAEHLVATLVSQARFDAALAAAREQAQRDQAQRHAAIAEFTRLAEEFAALVDAGDSAAARALQERLAEIETVPGTIPAALARRIEPLRARHAELSRWQHWSNQRRRRALCDEIGVLAAERAHPDAIAARVRDARAEWQQLDLQERDVPATSPLARRFASVCQRALRPAAGYFEKRGELRAARTRELDSLLARAASFPSDSSDLKALAAMRQELSAALRALDDADPRRRSALARDIKTAIAAISARLAARASEVREAKAGLVARVRGLPPGDRGAARAVRELQQQWTALGEGDRAVDQRQWREFRAACDSVFGALDAQRRQAEADTAEHTAKAQAVVAQAGSALADASLTPEALAARGRELEAAWRALAPAPRPLAQQFEKSMAALGTRGAQAARGARLARYTAALERFRALRDIENAGGAVEAWTADGPDCAFAAALAARHAHPAASAGEVAAAVDTARDVLVKLEFLAGAASPECDRARRMDYQVRRLSDRMRGGLPAAAEDLDSLIVAWFGLPAGLPAPLQARFDAAVDAALAALP